jgi:hypothetical protein
MKQKAKELWTNEADIIKSNIDDVLGKLRWEIQKVKNVNPTKEVNLWNIVKDSMNEDLQRSINRAWAKEKYWSTFDNLVEEASKVKDLEWLMNFKEWVTEVLGQLYKQSPELRSDAKMNAFLTALNSKVSDKINSEIW